MKDKIQFSVTCGPNSYDFLSLLIYSADKLSSGKYDIEYLIYCNHIETPVDKIKSIKSKYSIKIFQATEENTHHEKDFSVASAHGEGLDFLLSKMTSKYGVISDVDVAFLARDWDEKLISTLDDKNIIVGSEYRASLNGSCYKYQNFPAAFLIAFLVEPIQKLNISFVPKNEKIFVSSENIHIYGGPIGRVVNLDTGCELPEKIIPAGYTGLPLKTLCFGHPTAKFARSSDMGDEFVLNDEPIATHKGRSISRKIIDKWKDKVIAWVDK